MDGMNLISRELVHGITEQCGLFDNKMISSRTAETSCLNSSFIDRG